MDSMGGAFQWPENVVYFEDAKEKGWRETQDAA